MQTHTQPPTSKTGAAGSLPQQNQDIAAAGYATAFSVVVLVCITVLSYSPVLFNFFCGDDFVHLTWLSEAVKHPELILRNFHSSWLDGTTTKFYRPLISVFMVSDYLLWRTNGFGFHVTNLLFLLGTSLWLFAIVVHLSRAFELDNRFPRWALGCAFLFALYPLHPEAVSWITGRVDAIVTFFCLASFYCYLRWRQNASLPWFCAAGLSMILALLSKEMAITLPALFLCWELFKPVKRNSAPLSAKRSIIAGLVRPGCNIVSPTLFFWGLLAAYFLVRRIALGTFVGGYDDSLFYIANFKEFALGWLHALKMFLVPLNKEIMGAHHILTRAWNVLLALDAIFILTYLWLEPRLRRPFMFICFWLALSLAPVYKLFSIADDLQGSRLGYLATAPLCVLLASAFVSLSNKGAMPQFWDRLRTAAFLSFTALCACVLWMNNQSWAAAGHESNAIRAQLEKLYSVLPGDPQVVLIGLPDNIHGAYVCRNAVWGMVKSPQLSRDIQNCLMIDRFEPILPFGFLKQSLQQSRESVAVYRWDATQKQFLSVELPEAPAAQAGSQWSQADLQRILKPLAGTTSSWRQDGCLKVSSIAPARPSISLKLDGTSCWNVDFVAVHLEVQPGQSVEQGADLLYANDLNPNFELRQRVHASIRSTAIPQTLIFPLHGLPDWTLGGKCRGLKLLLPAGTTSTVSGIELLAPQRLIPSLTFSNAGFLGSKGYLHLNQSQASAIVYVDAGKVPGASGFIFEIARPNLYFATQNAAQSDRGVMTAITRHCAAAELVLRRDMFPSAGMYQARAWAIDKSGMPLGLAGDHIILSIDN